MGFEDRQLPQQPGLRVRRYRPRESEYAWTFGGVDPVDTVRPGEVLELYTEDCFGGRIRSATDLPAHTIEFPFINPQTGPFYVEGAEPGDTLVLHVVDLKPARDWGVSAAMPFFGGLTSTDRTATLQDALPDTTWIYHLDRSRNTVGFQARFGDFSVELPLEPMLGTVGVAPPAGEVRTSLVPERFGGNMDTPEMRAGATCYLGVNVEGALFSVGDGHYRQGEGEACGTAVEGAMDSTILVELIKGGGPLWPRLETDDALMVVGSSRPMEDSWRIAQVEMVRWFQELYGLHQLDAYQLLSQMTEVPVANVVDTNYSVVVKTRKSLLPSVKVYDGIHVELRRRAAAL